MESITIYFLLVLVNVINNNNSNSINIMRKKEIKQGKRGSVKVTQLYK